MDTNEELARWHDPRIRQIIFVHGKRWEHQPYGNWERKEWCPLLMVPSVCNLHKKAPDCGLCQGKPG